MDMGFPSGTKLKNQIMCGLREPGRTPLGRILLQALTGSEERLIAFARDLAACREASIDAFLHAQRQNEDYLAIGRLAVWVSILDAEKRALENGLSGYWLYRFLDRYFEDISRPEDLDRYYPDGVSFEFLQGLAINTLNYDRLAEHTLSTWIRNRFPRLDIESNNYPNSIASVVRHQHGSLGLFFDHGGRRGISFGGDVPEGPEEIRDRADRLRFWFEPKDNTPDSYSITNRSIELRGVHVVTGFGYHDLINHRFGAPRSRDAKLAWVIATSSADVAARAEGWLQATYGQSGVCITHLSNNAKCAEAIGVLLK